MTRTEEVERAKREQTARQIRQKITDFEILAGRAAIATEGVKTPLWAMIREITAKAERAFQTEVYDIDPAKFERRQAELRGARSILAEIEYLDGKEKHFLEEADRLRKILEVAEKDGRITREAE